MKVPNSYTGPLLLDDGKRPLIKLNHEQKNLLKQITTILSSVCGRNVAKSIQTSKTITTLMILLNMDLSTPHNVHLLYKHVRFFQLAQEGKLISTMGVYKTNNREIDLIGMDNYLKTTCYLDALLVAMFYSTSIYDFLLDPVADPNLSHQLQLEVEELKIILRFIINLLRAGHHINVQIMYQLLLSLNSLGCDIALSGTQQDSLQIFVFLVECLSLPLLTFKLAVIHDGKLNIADDLRVIEERVLLLSIPSNNQPNEQAIDLQDCLDKYFNNSVTVRRHIDKKVNSFSNGTFEPDESDETASDDISDDHNEMDEYQKQGILKPVYPETIQDNELTPVPTALVLSRDEERQSLQSFNSRPNISPTSTLSTPRVNSALSPTLDSVLNFTGQSLEKSDSDKISQSVSSFKNVNEKLTHQRTRSSTLVSILNNAAGPNSNRITRRPSSISNAEVSLPAWMYMQLLPYYTDPNVNLTVENHEDFYRSRTTRSKTIDSTQFTPNFQFQPQGVVSSFERRFGTRRPIVPICLKRYTWNDRGQSVKIKRRVNIPEIMMYPFFIAEDRTKIGFVDFKRSSDFKSPCGSFMLVLQGCVCHRGHNVNSGHYVSITRKMKYKPNFPNKDEWILFNDLELNNENSKVFTLNELLEKEDPYILFYEIVELINNETAVIPPIGSNEAFWRRKPSAVSGTSDGTIVEQNSLFDDLKSSPLMHLNLGGLARSKSKSIDFDDVLDEYWWEEDERQIGSQSINTVINESSNCESGSSFELDSHNEFNANITSNSADRVDDTLLPKVKMIEISDSFTTTDTKTDDVSGNGGILEYEQENPNPFSLTVPLENVKSPTSQKSRISERSKDTVKDGQRKKKTVIGKLLKKVFN